MAKRLYSLFEVSKVLPNGKRRYRRISELALSKDKAIRVFQSALLAPYFTSEIMAARELRPVKQ